MHTMHDPDGSAHAQTNNYLATVTLKQGKVYAFFVKSPAKVRSKHAAAAMHPVPQRVCMPIKTPLLLPCRFFRAMSACSGALCSPSEQSEMVTLL